MPNRKDIADLRQDYQQGSLEIHEVAAHPFEQFNSWFKEAVASEASEANAMALSTVANHRPSTRIVLLKDLDDRGFVFFSNYQSRKGQEIAANPWVSLTFWWDSLERQVRIEGQAEKIEAADSDAYFQSRPRGSRIGAWASPQSEVIPSREILANKVAELTETYGEERPIPRPPHWGGYRVVPDFIEFWQGRSSRLHDRIAYQLGEAGRWSLSRLAP